MSTPIPKLTPAQVEGLRKLLEDAFDAGDERADYAEHPYSVRYTVRGWPIPPDRDEYVNKVLADLGLDMHDRAHRAPEPTNPHHRGTQDARACREDAE